MPIKLIAVLVLIVLVAVFTGFNLENKCTIWFFHSFTDIPVFASLLVSFLVGVIVTLPFTFTKGKKRDKDKDKQGDTSEVAQ